MVGGWGRERRDSEKEGLEEGGEGREGETNRVRRKGRRRGGRANGDTEIERRKVRGRGEEEERRDGELEKEREDGGWKRERGDRETEICLLYTSPSPRDCIVSRMPSSA